MSASTLFISLVIAATLVSYILCAFLKKPVNETVDYLVFYAIIGVSIITKAYIFNHQLKIGKDNALDHRINILGVASEAQKLCLDTLLSRWLLAKYIKLIESQGLSTAKDSSSRFTMTRLKKLLFASKKNN